MAWQSEGGMKNESRKFIYMEYVRKIAKSSTLIVNNDAFDPQQGS